MTTLHPLDRAPTLALGDAVVTGFSGTLAPDPAKTMPAGKTAVDQTFIDGNGPSVRIFDPRKPGAVWAGQYWAAPHRRDIPARAVGQVFGIAIDNRAFPDIFLTASSVYGLNIVMPDSDHDGQPERIKTGRANAGWAPGQFGPGGGPGSIWKIDGRTGQISRFADVTLRGRASGPAGLGNVAYDADHRQLFVSDLSTGMIHRFGLGGADLGHFDHGATARISAGLPPKLYEPEARADIASPDFNSEDPATWGFAPPERRVWGLAVHKGRLYYAVAAGRSTTADQHGNFVPDSGQIWSVGLTSHGDFAHDPRLEITLPGESRSAPISDIVFAHDGAMIVAQRASIGTHYDYKALPSSGIAHVYRFWPEKPDDPKTPSGWYQAPEEYAVGYAGDSRNSGGGVALGYGYKSDGTLDFDDCEDAIFFTGDMLRSFRKVMDEFLPDGPLNLFGLQIGPKGPVRGFNVPPSISYFVNYRDSMRSDEASGTVGNVAVYRLDCAEMTCAAAKPGGTVLETYAARPVPPAGPPPGTPPGNPPGTPPGNPPCVGLGCSPTPGCVGPDCVPCVGSDCGPVDPKMCMKVEGEAICDPEGGGWVYKLVTHDDAGIGIDMLTVHSSTLGVSVSNGPDISVVPPPGVVALSGATPGQTVMIDVCGFDSAARQTGKPYDCCHASLTLKIPQETCLPAGEHQ
ncbi:MAG: hypothetical protein P4L72_11800 [Parvibaculum sp.]|uniref:hypothetical protein n=1 Tax=Parvibaculum sp. TaxID=2024848 RepID=UPI0028404C69|nr:hypothetical protein [Parvibaculum sp.]MDR3499896.1 hypothetical protein [Parvibaculum sp.]